MLGFKESLQQDIEDTFEDLLEFAEPHVINGVEMPVVLDFDEKIQNEKIGDYEAAGVYLRQMQIYVNHDDFGHLPKIGGLLEVDGKDYIVTDAKNEYGMYCISLEKRRG